MNSTPECTIEQLSGSFNNWKESKSFVIPNEKLKLSEIGSKFLSSRSSSIRENSMSCITYSLRKKSLDTVKLKEIFLKGLSISNFY